MARRVRGAVGAGGRPEASSEPQGSLCSSGLGRRTHARAWLRQRTQRCAVGETVFRSSLNRFNGDSTSHGSAATRYNRDPSIGLGKAAIPCLHVNER
jgi:hypothetical protein